MGVFYSIKMFIYEKMVDLTYLIARKFDKFF